MIPVSTLPTGTVPIPPRRVSEHCLGRVGGHTNLVNILERKSERLVGRSRRGVDGVNGVEEGDTLGGSGLGLLGPSLVPAHLKVSVKQKKVFRKKVVRWWKPCFIST
jgi:hypothetical protein